MAKRVDRATPPPLPKEVGPPDLPFSKSKPFAACVKHPPSFESHIVAAEAAENYEQVCRLLDDYHAAFGKLTGRLHSIEARLNVLKFLSPARKALSNARNANTGAQIVDTVDGINAALLDIPVKIPTASDRLLVTNLSDELRLARSRSVIEYLRNAHLLVEDACRAASIELIKDAQTTVDVLVAKPLTNIPDKGLTSELAKAHSELCDKLVVGRMKVAARAHDWTAVMQMMSNISNKSIVYPDARALYDNARKSKFIRIAIRCSAAALFVALVAVGANILRTRNRIAKFEQNVSSGKYEQAATIAQSIYHQHEPAAVFLQINSNRNSLAVIRSELESTIGIDPGYLPALCRIIEHADQLLTQGKYSDSLQDYRAAMEKGTTFLSQQSKLQVRFVPDVFPLEMVMSDQHNATVITNRYTGGAPIAVSLVAGDWRIAIPDSRYRLPVSSFTIPPGPYSLPIHVERVTGFCSFYVTNVPSGIAVSIIDTNHALLGKAGEPIKLPSGPQSVVAVADGYRWQPLPVFVPADATTNYIISLEKEMGEVLIKAKLPQGFKGLGYLKGGAVLVVDGTNRMNITLPCSVALNPGTHQLCLELNNYRKGQTNHVVVRDKARQEVVFEMTPLPAIMQFRSSLTNAPINVYEDGLLLGETSSDIPLLPFIKHDLVFETPGYDALKLSVLSSIMPNSKYTYSLTNFVPVKVRSVAVDSSPTRYYGLLRIAITGAFNADGRSCVTINKQPFESYITADRSGNVAKCFVLPPGEHEISLDITGFKLSEPTNQAVRVSVKAGESTKLNIRMLPDSCNVRFLSRYKRAKIDVYNGTEKIGNCGEWLKLTPFVRYRLLFKGKRFFDHQAEMTFEQPGRNINVPVPIKPSGMMWGYIEDEEWEKLIMEAPP